MLEMTRYDVTGYLRERAMISDYGGDEVHAVNAEAQTAAQQIYHPRKHATGCAERAAPAVRIEKDKKARAGEIPNFTGISSPYETPEHPEVTIDTTGKSLADSVDYVMAQLEDLLN